ncbi:hypothetical protein BJX66DRAFT_138588 [Aspergillus keveii]|uniref:Secreted protein n=1 Tax=Aspergillus keveii TaxID=714993 RepID=A0ABR4FIT7_9EURO
MPSRIRPLFLVHGCSFSLFPILMLNSGCYQHWAVDPRTSGQGYHAFGKSRLRFIDNRRGQELWELMQEMSILGSLRRVP